MHHGYFERKMSQPSTSSVTHSMTPKLFNRLKEESTKSPERMVTHEYVHLTSNSPTVSGQRTMTLGNTSTSSSSKIATKVKEQVLHTDRLRTRTPQPTVYYNPKTSQNQPTNITIDFTRSKSSRSNNSIITKTEPNDIETNYTSQINKLLQKVNKLKFDLEQTQERENHHLSRVSNLEKETKTLQMMIDEKDKKIQDLTQKSKEDKLRMYQFLTELETYKQKNQEKQAWDEVSTARLSEMCDSGRRMDKVMLEKGTQATEASTATNNCSKCAGLKVYCDVLVNKLGEIEQSSRYVIQENTLMRESLGKAKRAENEYVKARTEIERRALEIQNDFDNQGQFYNEIIAENTAVRRVLKEVVDHESLLNQYQPDTRRNGQIKTKKDLAQKKFTPIPASLRALVGAEKIAKIAI